MTFYANFTPETDMLTVGQNARKMSDSIKRFYPKIYKTILKELDITEYEIRAVRFTKRQYEKLVNFCQCQKINF